LKQQVLIAARNNPMTDMTVAVAVEEAMKGQFKKIF